MTEAQLTLLHTVADVLKAHLWFDPIGTPVEAARLQMAIDAAQTPTGPKPRVVSDEAFRRAIDAYYKAPCEPMRAALEAAAPFICAAKDRDTRTVIADNDAKMAEIERLKAGRQIWEDQAIRLQHELSALRHPNIEARVDKIRRLRACLRSSGTPDAIYCGTLTKDSAGRIVEALVAREGE